MVNKVQYKVHSDNNYGTCVLNTQTKYSVMKLGSGIRYKRKIKYADLCGWR